MKKEISKEYLDNMNNDGEYYGEKKKSLHCELCNKGVLEQISSDLITNYDTFICSNCGITHSLIRRLETC